MKHLEFVLCINEFNRHIKKKSSLLMYCFECDYTLERIHLGLLKSSGLSISSSCLSSLKRNGYNDDDDDTDDDNQHPSNLWDSTMYQVPKVHPYN